jgi:hypothetical protein
MGKTHPLIKNGLGAHLSDIDIFHYSAMATMVSGIKGSCKCEWTFGIIYTILLVLALDICLDIIDDVKALSFIYDHDHTFSKRCTHMVINLVAITP